MGFADWKQNKKKFSGKEADQIISKSFFDDSRRLPIVYKPKTPSLDLPSWYKDNVDLVKQDLQEHGAVLLRGFYMTDAEKFKHFVDIAIKNKAAYVEGATPRTELQDGIYTSTEFPAEQEIALHNELSYVTQPPGLLVFCCLTAATTGGQTPIVDVSKVYKRLSDELLNEFEQRGGWLLQRNYGNGFGPTINKAFGINDIDGIKSYCEKADVEMEIISERHVVTRQTRSAVHYHPQSGQSLWFNHIVFWHPSSLCPKVKAQLSGMFSLSEFPYSTYFADGSEIPERYITQIRQAYRDEEVVFDWCEGDILLLDNWQVGHGRKPFTGDRKVLVAMG